MAVSERFFQMETQQLRCFVAAAEETHFGRAAERLKISPSSLGRQLRLLEESLGAPLFNRTTRSVSLTTEGLLLLEEARNLILQADRIGSLIRDSSRAKMQTIRIGAIDSAAAGLIPLLVYDISREKPGVKIEILEEKSVSLIPKLLSGRLDLAFVRPRPNPNPEVEHVLLLNEVGVAAVPTSHPLAEREYVSVDELIDQPLILPERKLRPHSHDLTIRLFADVGVAPIICQYATEKHTILNLVAAGVGIAIVPRWSSRIGTPGVSFIELRAVIPEHNSLPLAVAWMRGVRDPLRDSILTIIHTRLANYIGG